MADTRLNNIESVTELEVTIPNMMQLATRLFKICNLFEVSQNNTNTMWDKLKECATSLPWSSFLNSQPYYIFLTYTKLGLLKGIFDHENDSMLQIIILVQLCMCTIWVIKLPEGIYHKVRSEVAKHSSFLSWHHWLQLPLMKIRYVLEPVKHQVYNNNNYVD